MNGVISSPPTTYQDWINCFEYMKTSKINDDFIEMISQGSFAGSQEMNIKLQQRIISLLNEVIDRRTKKFIKDLNMLLESNDAAGIVVLFKNYNKELMNCIFFHRIDCIPISFRVELSDSIKKQTNEFLQKVICQISVDSLEANNSDMEDALYQIRKIRVLQ